MGLSQQGKLPRALMHWVVMAIEKPIKTQRKWKTARAFKNKKKAHPCYFFNFQTIVKKFLDKRKNLKRNRSAPRLDYPTKELGEKKDFVSCFFPAHFFSSFLPFVNQREVFFGKPLLFSNAQLISWKAPKGFSHSLSSYYVSVPNDYIRELLYIQRLTSSIRAF